MSTVLIGFGGSVRQTTVRDTNPTGETLRPELRSSLDTQRVWKIGHLQMWGHFEFVPDFRQSPPEERRVDCQHDSTVSRGCSNVSMAL